MMMADRPFCLCLLLTLTRSPLENEEPIPVVGPLRSRAVAMLPGPSVLRSLIPIEEVVDLNNDVRFIPPHFVGERPGRMWR
jgi:hypothetical protein